MSPIAAHSDAFPKTLQDGEVGRFTFPVAQSTEADPVKVLVSASTGEQWQCFWNPFMNHAGRARRRRR
jgi:hypothetical protein